MRRGDEKRTELGCIQNKNPHIGECGRNRKRGGVFNLYYYYVTFFRFIHIRIMLLIYFRLLLHSGWFFVYVLLGSLILSVRLVLAAHARVQHSCCARVLNAFALNRLAC